jgi:chromate transporter
MMEDEVVRKRAWLSPQEFLDLLGAVNLIPGPNSTELAILVGYRRAGWRGLLLAGAGFIMPAVLIVGVIAWAYVKFGALPAAAAVLNGIKPVIIAVVAMALWSLSRTGVKNLRLAVIAVLACVFGYAGLDPLVLLVIAGFLAGITSPTASAAGLGKIGAFLAPSALAGTATVTVIPFNLLSLFLFFLKVGAVLYGSGYVLLAFLRDGLVAHLGWLTERQLLDAIAVGQFTPGPLFTTATFVGYIVGGVPGGAVATLGIFLPSFVLSSVCAPLVAKIRASPLAGAFLDGVNVASLALMAAVTVRLASSAVVDVWTAATAVTAFVLLARWKVNSVWLIVAGGVIGSLRSWLA